MVVCMGLSFFFVLGLFSCWVEVVRIMAITHSIGIDLGTTYSCIAYLDEQGHPVAIPNEYGELATPSVVLFDGDRAVVGTEALSQSVLSPGQVVRNSKRFIGNASHCWNINGKRYSPVDIATIILKKLLADAQRKLGPIDQAVITVPAQFNDAQRNATIEAGRRAGLTRIDIVNEPVAAALCYVFGEEGLWFNELAERQNILVYDLGGGTFDLSLIAYEKDEVSVMISSGDLMLGGIDWNYLLEQHVSRLFQKKYGCDPRSDSSVRQAMSLESERAKRNLSKHPRTAFRCEYAGKVETYSIEQTVFEELAADLIAQTRDITVRMLKENKMGWAHVDVVLVTGGASRMPMIRNMLKQISGRTLNTALSPDLSIAHGASYYAGMLISSDTFAQSFLSKEAARQFASVKQRSVNARALGIMVRNPKTGKREPHYILPANMPLPTDATNYYGTVVPNQKRVHLRIVESGTSSEHPPAILGDCVIDQLPPVLPVGSKIAVNISYDSAARVSVSAKEVISGHRARAEIIRHENVVPQLASDAPKTDDSAADSAAPVSLNSPANKREPQVISSPTKQPKPVSQPVTQPTAKRSPQPVLPSPQVPPPVPTPQITPPLPKKTETVVASSQGDVKVIPPPPPLARPDLAKIDTANFLEPDEVVAVEPRKLPAKKRSSQKPKSRRQKPSSQKRSAPSVDQEVDPGKEEFWSFLDE